MHRRALILAFTFGSAGCLFAEDSCIAAGVFIMTPRGRVPIEQLRVGDRVLSVDPEGGTLVEVAVTAIRSAPRECVALSLPTGEQLVCTPDHPVFDPDTQTYRDAGDWVLGEARQLLLVVQREVQPAEPRASRAYTGLHRVFDLTVDGPHSNFVANGVVVHNKSYVNDYDTAWYDDAVSSPCPIPLGDGEACLELRDKEFHYVAGTATIADNTITYALEPAPGAPDVLLHYAASNVAQFSGNVAADFKLQFPTTTLNSYYGDCLITAGTEAPIPGGTVSGSLGANVTNTDTDFEYWESELVWQAIPVGQ